MMSRNPLPANIYDAAQVRAIDQSAVELMGLAGGELMERAGQAVFHIIQAKCPTARIWRVICGKGNNGGDGYVIARLAKQAGFVVQLGYLVDPQQLSGDALQMAELAGKAGVSMVPAVELSGEPDIIIDALLGTGLRGEVRDDSAAAISAINHSKATVCSVDVPSGLCADTGSVLGAAVKADFTVCVIALKGGLVTAEGRSCCGELCFESLQVPLQAYSPEPVAQLLGQRDLQVLGEPRDQSAHKGKFGHVLVVGGDYGFAGAAILAAQGALRSGAGLVSLATQPAHVAAALAAQPEIMAHGLEHAGQLEGLVSRASVLVIGPGLGQQAWGQNCLQLVLATLAQTAVTKPLLVDADALNWLAKDPSLAELLTQLPHKVLTPHPGEAARLLGCSVAEVQRNRYGAAQALVQRYQAVIILKGAGTIIATPQQQPKVINAGNPGMASGGMGDVLAGVAGALLAQGFDCFEAGYLGALLHSLAADRAAEKGGERGLLAGDLLAPLRELVNGRGIQ